MSKNILFLIIIFSVFSFYGCGEVAKIMGDNSTTGGGQLNFQVIPTAATRVALNLKILMVATRAALNLKIPTVATQVALNH